MDKTIIYIHGFGSIGNSHKGRLIKESFPNERVFTPDFTFNTIDAVNKIKDLIRYKNPVLVGSSLGGFYADYFNTIYNIPCVIINPLVYPLAVESYIGVNRNYYTGKDFDFTRESFNYLLKLKEEKESSINYNNRIAREIVLLAMDDELIDNNLSLEEFNSCNVEVKTFPDGGHRFTRDDDIVEAIKKMV